MSRRKDFDFDMEQTTVIPSPVRSEILRKTQDDGVTTLAGVIDPGYRGEIKVVMTNLGAAAVEISAGDRIAQLRIVQRIEAQFEEVDELGEAARGVGGFGSTGA